MPLIPPAIDDRSYDDLVQDLLANIPAHTPEWTNPQPGDPGRTLLELFAWLADTILYRANLIPEKQRIAFLKLLGQTMQPAAAATDIVSLSLGASSVTPVGIVAGATIKGPVNFETQGDIDVLPVTAQAYIKVALTPGQQKQSLALLTGLKTLYGLSTIPASYTTTPVFANNLADPNGIDFVNGSLPSDRVASGMYVNLYSGATLAARAVVSDLDSASVNAIVTDVFTPGTYLNTTDTAHFTTLTPQAIALRPLFG